MPRYGIAIDSGKCVGCYNCFLTCRDEYAGNEYPGYSAPQPKEGGNWIRLDEIERGEYPHIKISYVHMLCSHCDDAACAALDKSGAVYRRPDGIVLIDPEKAKGNKGIVDSCPYRRIEWNEGLSLPQKCTMCAHLLDAGDPVPRCVESCPSGALVFGDLDDPLSAVSKLVASGGYGPLKGGYAMGEKVLYKGLPGKFVAGTVTCGDIDEVAVGAEVALTGPDFEKTIYTNGFGDFEFDGLPGNTGFTVRIKAFAYEEADLAVKTSRDVYLGEIKLSKKTGG
ncbi:MAG: oxidoreductase [Clostridiales bacterium]|nr:oxidoreductase [Clostridiales bacterium]